LFLDDEEAVAVAVGLSTAAVGGVTGIEDTALRALAKLESVLPSRLRGRVGGLQRSTVFIPGSGPTVRGDALTTIAGAIREHDRLRFAYEGYDGTSGLRTVEPHRLVHMRGRWYLVAWDTHRDDWRTFRADRLQAPAQTSPKFVPRADPDGDVVAYVEKGLRSAMWRYRARVTVHASAERVIARVPPPSGVEPLDEHTCTAYRGFEVTVRPATSGAIVNGQSKSSQGHGQQQGGEFPLADASAGAAHAALQIT
jgi:predicted DNA-binding transcriptional regulator YafY